MFFLTVALFNLPRFSYLTSTKGAELQEVSPQLCVSANVKLNFRLSVAALIFFSGVSSISNVTMSSHQHIVLDFGLRLTLVQLIEDIFPRFFVGVARKYSFSDP